MSDSEEEFARFITQHMNDLTIVPTVGNKRKIVSDSKTVQQKIQSQSSPEHIPQCQSKKLDPEIGIGIISKINQGEFEYKKIDLTCRIESIDDLGEISELVVSDGSGRCNASIVSTLLKNQTEGSWLDLVDVTIRERTLIIGARNVK